MISKEYLQPKTLLDLIFSNPVTVNFYEMEKLRDKVLRVYRNPKIEIMMQTLLYINKLVEKTTGIPSNRHLHSLREYTLTASQEELRYIGLAASSLYERRMFLFNMFNSVRQRRDAMISFLRYRETVDVVNLIQMYNELEEFKMSYVNHFVLANKQNITEVNYVIDNRLIIKNSNTFVLDILFYITKQKEIFKYMNDPSDDVKISKPSKNKYVLEVKLGEPKPDKPLRRGMKITKIEQFKNVKGEDVSVNI